MDFLMYHAAGIAIVVATGLISALLVWAIRGDLK